MRGCLHCSLLGERKGTVPVSDRRIITLKFTEFCFDLDFVYIPSDCHFTWQMHCFLPPSSHLWISVLGFFFFFNASLKYCFSPALKQAQYAASNWKAKQSRNIGGTP